eukprot:2227438-Rhodomonas_salina.1
MPGIATAYGDECHVVWSRGVVTWCGHVVWHAVRGTDMAGGAACCALRDVSMGRVSGYKIAELINKSDKDHVSQVHCDFNCKPAQSLHCLYQQRAVLLCIPGNAPSMLVTLFCGFYNAPNRQFCTMILDPVLTFSPSWHALVPRGGSSWY